VFGFQYIPMASPGLRGDEEKLELFAL